MSPRTAALHPKVNCPTTYRRFSHSDPPQPNPGSSGSYVPSPTRSIPCSFCFRRRCTSHPSQSPTLDRVSRRSLGYFEPLWPFFDPAHDGMAMDIENTLSSAETHFFVNGVENERFCFFAVGRFGTKAETTATGTTEEGLNAFGGRAIFDDVCVLTLGTGGHSLRLSPLLNHYLKFFLLWYIYCGLTI